MRPEKRYIQKHVQERRNPKRLPNLDDLQKLHERIEKQALSAEGQIALIADDSERVELMLMGYALRGKQEELAVEIESRRARAEREKGEPVGDFQRIGGVLAKMASL